MPDFSDLIHAAANGETERVDILLNHPNLAENEEEQRLATVGEALLQALEGNHLDAAHRLAFHAYEEHLSHVLSYAASNNDMPMLNALLPAAKSHPKSVTDAAWKEAYRAGHVEAVEAMLTFVEQNWPPKHMVPTLQSWLDSVVSQSDGVDNPAVISVVWQRIQSKDRLKLGTQALEKAISHGKPACARFLIDILPEVDTTWALTLALNTSSFNPSNFQPPPSLIAKLVAHANMPQLLADQHISVVDLDMLASHVSPKIRQQWWDRADPEDRVHLVQTQALLREDQLRQHPVLTSARRRPRS